MSDVSELLEEAQQVHSEKNDDYGEAWRTVGDILWLMAGQEEIVLESPEDISSFGLYWERYIKLQRAFNGEFVANDLNFESIEDSHTDNIPYSAMHAALQSYRE